MKDEFDITRNIRMIEWLKAEIVGSSAELYRRMAVNADSRHMAEAIADIIIKAYLLAEKLGIGYGATDIKIQELLKKNEDDGQSEDLNSLYRYLSASRTRSK